MEEVDVGVADAVPVIRDVRVRGDTHYHGTKDE